MLAMRTVLGAAAAGLVCAPALAQNGLVIGVDDVNVPVQIYNNGAWEPLFSGIEAWGIAVDNATCTLYIGAANSLYSFRPGDAAPTLVGTFNYNGSNVNFVGLAFNEGSLYGVRNITTEAVYQIDPATAVATLLWAYPTAFDFGGLDFDSAGTLYGTSDSTTGGSGRGLYIIDTTAQTTTFVVGYPAFAGQNNDIDGLAIGDGRAYFVVDEPGDIAVYNLTTMAFEAPLANPWTTSEIFSAAAFAPCFLGDECPADFNNSGDLTLADFVAFRNAYVAGCP